MKRRLELGKVDYNQSGRRNCMAELEWELSDDGRFSMSGTIWNPIHSDCYCCGQCVDDVVAYFPHNKLAQRMCEIWKRWHLNDMKAGTPKQEAAIEAWERQGNQYDYTLACEYLKSINLYNDNGYKYGTAWLKEEIPQDIKDEILSWPTTTDES